MADMQTHDEGGVVRFCPTCEPDRLPSARGRIADGHVSVFFCLKTPPGEHALRAHWERMHTTVRLYGVEQRICWEAVPGDDGVCYVWDDTATGKKFCTRCGSALLTERRGLVHVQIDGSWVERSEGRGGSSDGR